MGSTISLLCCLRHNVMFTDIIDVPGNIQALEVLYSSFQPVPHLSALLYSFQRIRNKVAKEILLF